MYLPTSESANVLKTFIMICLSSSLLGYSDTFVLKLVKIIS